MLSDLFKRFRKPITIIRKSGGANVNGEWVGETESQIQIYSSVQPLAADEMQLLPEGRYTTETYKIYTDFVLMTVSSQNPDVVIVNSERFEVIDVFPFQSKVISHYKVFIGKVIRNANL